MGKVQLEHVRGNVRTLNNRSNSGSNMPLRNWPGNTLGGPIPEVQP